MNLAAAAAVTLAAQFGHNGAVGTVDISPHGAFVLSGSNDNSTRLWDADSGRLLRVHVGHDDQNIVAVRFHPDGRRFWSVAQSGVLREWSTSTGEELRSLTAQGIRSMDMTADGRLIVLAELNSGTSIWDGLTFKLIRRLPAGSSNMMVAAVSHDARMVAVGDQAGAITVYELRTGDVDAIRELTGEAKRAAATVAAVKGAAQVIADARPEDTLVLFVAGHGLSDGTEDAEYFYLTHEADLRSLPTTAAPFRLFEELLLHAKPRRKLFLLDTCESGEVDPDAEGVRVAALTGSRGLRARSTRSVSFAATAVAAPKGAKSKATPASEAWRRTLVRRDRFIYNDLARRSGTVVFSSSRGGELSYESPAWQDGLFTEELVRALTTSVAELNGDKVVTARELRRHVSEAVGRLSKGAQNPVVDRDNIHQHISFPIGAPAP